MNPRPRTTTSGPPGRTGGSAARGAALIEGALVIPLVALLGAFAVDAYWYYASYDVLLTVGRETVIAGAAVPGLSGAATDRAVTLSEYEACLEPGTMTPDCGTLTMHYKARSLLGGARHRLDASSLRVSTAFDAAARVLTVTLAADYVPVFPKLVVFTGTTVRVVQKSTRIGQ